MSRQLIEKQVLLSKEKFSICHCGSGAAGQFYSVVHMSGQTECEIWMLSVVLSEERQSLVKVIFAVSFEDSFTGLASKVAI